MVVGIIFLTLLLPEAFSIWWTFLCVARLVLDSLAQAKSSSILRRWIITLTVRKLYPSATGARTLSPGSPGTPVSIYHSLGILHFLPEHTATIQAQVPRATGRTISPEQAAILCVANGLIAIPMTAPELDTDVLHRGVGAVSEIRPKDLLALLVQLIEGAVAWEARGEGQNRGGGVQEAVSVTIIQELREVDSTAGRPGQRLVHVDEEWRHHVVLAHGPKQSHTWLRIIMGHAENVS